MWRTSANTVLPVLIVENQRPETGFKAFQRGKAGEDFASGVTERDGGARSNSLLVS
jgi:hypothetical protein